MGNYESNIHLQNDFLLFLKFLLLFYGLHYIKRLIQPAELSRTSQILEVTRGVQRQMLLHMRSFTKLIRHFFIIGLFVMMLMCVLVSRDLSDAKASVKRALYFTRTKPGMPTFKPYDDTNTKTMHTVCLTQRQVKFHWSDSCGHIWLTKKQKFRMFCKGCLHEQKGITVYIDNQTELDQFRKNKWMKGVGFNINARLRSELPKDHVIIRNQTAYFLGKSPHPHEPYNFFHFTKQIFFPLHHLMKSTNQLQEGAQNIIFYPGPYAMCERNKRIIYFDVDKYKHFRDLLFIKNKVELSAYVDQPDPDKICYENAVFSKNFFLHQAPEAINYFKNSLAVRDVCEHRTLTIINRSSYRRILNTEDMKTIAEDLGYHARIVEMEKLTLKEQAQLIHCTDVLVGVAAAGLQWAYFMKDHSSVFEIAWPQKEWFFFFSSDFPGYRSEEKDVIRPLKFFQLNAKYHFNPPALNIYARDIFHQETNFSDEVAMEIFRDPRNYGFAWKPVMSVGKLCDAEVDLLAFRAGLASIG